MKNNLKYYLGIEANCQWQTVLFSETEDADLVESFDIPSDIKGPILSNIFNRETFFSYKSVKSDFYYGWTISQLEFNKIKRALELYPLVQEYYRSL
ncbi:MAG: hypothetical protein AABY22_20815, partial [Nanoarchaeota archaeon]